ncbi:MAG: SDR family NAD(P)-dependent oxidoreductase [Myxococcota bacterium]
MNFDGKQAIVTGGTGGLGRAVVSTLVDAGARVHVPVFIEAELEDFAFADHEAVTLHRGLDLGKEADVRALFSAVPDLYASIHLAGGFAFGPLKDTEQSTWDHLLRLNATTCFLCCRQAVRSFGEGPGRIVNVAARPVLVPTAQLGAYAASKAAVAAITTTLAEELASSSIWVNAIVPSIIDTPTNRTAMPDADVRDWAKPEDVAQTVAFLASPANRVTRGALVPVYGRG